MPIIEDAVENLKKIKNLFRLKIFIFSHRDWPQYNGNNKEIKKIWKEKLKDFYVRLGLGNICKRILVLDWYIFKKPIDKITKLWLYSHGFKFAKISFLDKENSRLIIEKGNEEVSDPRGKSRNRFFISSKKKIKFFVEDDIRKAIKLSYICEVVFLFNQSYNQAYGLPKNIVRVNSWEDIYRKIRELI